MPLAAIATEKEGWHSRRLRQALEREGFDCFSFSLGDCWHEAGPGKSRPFTGHGRRLPDAVVVRTIPAGTFEQITMKINILKFFHENGVKVFNNADAISLSVDKIDCINRLCAMHIAVPHTWVYESESAARELLQNECAAGNSMVCKPLFGAEGRNLQMFTNGSEEFNEVVREQGIFVLQRFIGCARANEFHDYRVLVLAGRAIAAMRRSSKSWITNVARGAEVAAVPLDAPLCRTAEKAAMAVGLDIAGVDLIADEHGLVVLELNSIPSWRALQAVSGFDIAACFARHIASCTGNGGAGTQGGRCQN